MELIKPTLKYRKSWEEAIQAFRTEGVSGFWNIPTPPADINDYLQRVQKQEKGIDLPDYWVPASTFWLIDEEKLVAHVNIRHTLTENLKRFGGHIGYYVCPAERRKGYGTRILELALKEARKLGLKKVLITCSDNNIGSQKVIEKNGGLLTNSVEVEAYGLVRHYWIEFK